MNQAQKKYAINRLYKICLDKLLPIARTYDKEKREYDNIICITNREIYDGIVAGTVPFAAGTSKNKSLKDSVSLTLLIQIKEQKLQIQAPKSHPSNNPKLQTSADSYSFYSFSLELRNAVDKANKMLQVAEDNIYLGSEQDALDAIKKFNNVTF